MDVSVVGRHPREVLSVVDVVLGILNIADHSRVIVNLDAMHYDYFVNLDNSSSTNEGESSHFRSAPRTDYG
jgi:hypothetical protein